MAYLVGQSISGLGFGEPELVGWPATMRGLGEPPTPFAVVGDFAFDKSDLGPPQHTKIVAVARHIMASAIRTVRLVGHTDPVGTPDYNRGLGQRRADAVRRALLATLDRMRPGSAASVTVSVDSAGEGEPLPGQPAASNRRVEVLLTTPVPRPVTPAVNSTHVVKVVVKSAIMPVRGNLGLLGQCFPQVAMPKLARFAQTMDRIIRDDLSSDAKDRKYRLYSEKTFRVVCRDGQIVSVQETPIDTDVGQECMSVPVIGQQCLQPPALIVSDEALDRTGPDTFAFKWSGRGRPHDMAEFAFQAICPRTSKFIWHTVTGSLRCDTSGINVAVQLQGSKFPTHAVFVNGVSRTRVPQGWLSALWDAQSTYIDMVQ